MMFWTLGLVFTKRLNTMAAVLSVLTAVLFLSVPASAQKAGNRGFVFKSYAEVMAERGSDNGVGTTFPGTGTGAIPDATVAGPRVPGTPLNITFNVTGVPSAPTSVSVNFTSGTPGHTFIGDLEATLIAPNGTTHRIFGYTGITTPTGFGIGSDLTGGALYVFNNAATTSWWTNAATNPIPAGAFRTSNSGGLGATNPMPATDINAAFAGIPTSNGTWTLRFTDGAGGDTGSISAANLTLTAGAPPVSQPTHVDMDGDGKSDISVVRDNSPPTLTGGDVSPMFSAGSGRERMAIVRKMQESGDANLGTPGSTITWYVSQSQNGAAEVLTHGTAATDFVVPADFDGDGQDDHTVWRDIGPTGPNAGFFYILNSSNSTVTEVDFGIRGDNPAVVGDYDGDGRADPAVFRCPDTVAGQCFYYVKRSTNGVLTGYPLGFGTASDKFAYPGDFDGDGKYDFCIQQDGGGNQARFVLVRSSDLGVEYINWGLFSDLMIPGDYDGDGKSDFAVGRNQGGQRVWYVLTRTGSAFGAQFGLGNDILTPGDYDGDNKQDIAVFRPSADPNNNVWYILQSSTQTVRTFEWGQFGDAPVENFRVQ